MLGLKSNRRVSGTDGTSIATSAMYNTCPPMMTSDDNMLAEQTMYGQMNGFGINCMSAVLPQDMRQMPAVGITSGSAQSMTSQGVDVVSGATNIYHPGYPVNGFHFAQTGYEGLDGNTVGTLPVADVPIYGQAERMDQALPSYDGISGMINQQGTIPNVPTPADHRTQAIPTHGGLINSRTHIRPKVSPRVIRHDRNIQ